MAYRHASPPPAEVTRIPVRPRPNLGAALVLALLGVVAFALVASWTTVRCDRTGGACVARTLSFRGVTEVAFSLDAMDRVVVDERPTGKGGVRSSLVLVERAPSRARRPLEPAHDAFGTARRYAVARELGLFQIGRDPSFEASFGGRSVAVGGLALALLVAMAASHFGHGATLEIDAAAGWIVVRRRAFFVRRRPLELPLDEALDVVNGGTRKAPTVHFVRSSGDVVTLTAGRLDDAQLDRVRRALGSRGRDVAR